MTQGRVRRSIAAGVGLAVVLASAACGSGAATNERGGGESHEFEFTVQSVYGPEAEQSQALLEWTEAITEDTDGAVTFEFAYGPTLAPLAEVEEAMATGLIDIALGLPVYSPDKFPINTTLAELAPLVESSPVLGTLQMAAFMETGFSEEVISEIEDLGLKTLMPMWGWMNEFPLICKGAPVSSLADAKGRKVRVGGAVWEGEVQALGMEPVFLPADEMFDAYQRGMFDCIAYNWADIVHSGLLAESDYLMTDPEVGFSGWASMHLSMGLDQWDSMPVEYQQAFWDNLSKHNARFVQAGFVNSKLASDVIEENGIEVVAYEDDLRDALRDHQAANVASVKQRLEGLVEDPDALVDGLIEDVESWKSILREDLDMSEYEQYANWADWIFESEHDEVDVSAWADYLQENIYDPRRPK